MMLSVSAKSLNKNVDVKAVVDDEHVADSGIEFAKELTAFAESIARHDQPAMDSARTALLDAAGPAAVVDAAGVAANFQRMTRIADCTGIPLDPPMNIMTSSLRDKLGLNKFAAAENTKKLSAPMKMFAAIVAPIGMRLMTKIATRKK